MFLKKNVWQLWEIFLGVLAGCWDFLVNSFCCNSSILNFLPVGKKLALCFHDLAF